MRNIKEWRLSQVYSPTRAIADAARRSPRISVTLGLAALSAAPGVVEAATRTAVRAPGYLVRDVVRSAGDVVGHNNDPKVSSPTASLIERARDSERSGWRRFGNGVAAVPVGLVEFPVRATVRAVFKSPWYVLEAAGRSVHDVGRSGIKPQRRNVRS